MTLNTDGTFSYTHDGSETTTDSFTYTVDDSAGATSNVATVSITVTPVNDEPVANVDAITLDEGGTATQLVTTETSVKANDTDAEDGIPGGNVTLVTDVVNGTLTLNTDGTFSYTHDGTDTTSDSFEYSVQDSNGATSNTATVQITIGGVNDDPVANDDSITVDEGGTATVLDSTETSVKSNDTDSEDITPAGNVALVSDVSNGTLTLNTDGTFSYTHDGSETTTDSFTYTVDDSAGATSNVATVSITVTPVNDDPGANDDAITVDEGGTATVLDSTEATVQANDTDAEDGVPSGNVALVSDVSNGTLTLNADGTFSYTHDGSETTTDSFTYTVDDSAGATSNVATVSITVTPVNEAPIAGDSEETTDEDTPVDGDFDVTDPDGDDPATMAYDIVQPSQGVVSDDDDGSFTFDPNGEFDYLEAGESEQVQFTYTVTDQGGLPSGTGTVTITVNGVNDSDPVTVVKAYEAHEVLYRVNAGGPELASLDSGPAWSADTLLAPSPYLDPVYAATGTNTTYTGPATIDMSGVPDEAKINGLYTQERWDELAAPNLGYDFPAPPGQELEVRLYFAEIFDGIDTPNERDFDVTIDGVLVLDDYDPWSVAGGQDIALMESFLITSDGIVDIELIHVNENPAIKAIEIIAVGDTLIEPGGTFVYTATITNPGTNGENISITGVTDSAAGDVGASCESALPFDLAPGASLDCVFELDHTVAGDYSNTVTVAATAASGEDASAVSNEVTATVEESPAVPAASVGITTGEGLAASTYTAGAFEVTNDSIDLDIVSVTYDIGTALFPDVVFDPSGTAGDATGKCFTPDTGAAATGYVVTGDPCVDPFSVFHNGIDGSDGFEAVTATFTDFNPGETFAFSVDIDPNNIKGAASTGFAGAVSGLEMTGTTITVEFSDGSTIVTNTWRTPSSAGGSEAAVAEPVPLAPAIDGVTGVTLAPVGTDRSAATVTDPSQTVTVSGPVAADVSLLVVEGGLTTGAAYLVEEFDANEALDAANIVEYPGTIGAGGTVDIPVTLTKSGVDGGYNLMIAVIDDGSQTGLTSNIVVLRLEESIAGSATAGTTVTTDGDGDGADPHDPIEASVTVPSTGGPYDVSITEQAATPPSGFTVLGQEVDITVSPAPASPADPFILTFEIDASLLGDPITVLKDGAVVLDCLAAGTADPDPCLESSVAGIRRADRRILRPSANESDAAPRSSWTIVLRPRPLDGPAVTGTPDRGRRPGLRVRREPGRLPRRDHVHDRRPVGRHRRDGRARCRHGRGSRPHRDADSARAPGVRRRR